MKEYSQYKTQIWKHPTMRRWLIYYYLPFSGPLVADFATWREAMDEAVEIERNRPW